jgi:DNA-binding FadR family transcriptional regulator
VVKVLAEVWRRRAEQGDNTRSTFIEHRAIFEAIQRRDPEAARAAMLGHLDLAKFYSQAPTHLELRVLGLRDVAA